MSGLQRARGLGYIVITHDLPVVRHQRPACDLYLGRMEARGQRTVRCHFRFSDQP